MAENLAAAQSGMGVDQELLTGAFDVSLLEPPKKP
jgi:hypothetical protein